MCTYSRAVSSTCGYLFLSFYFSRNEYWIGLEFQQGTACASCKGQSQLITNDPICLQCRATWSWQSGDAMTDSNGVLVLDRWWESEPDSAQNCGRLSTTLASDGSWFDANCGNEYGFICKEGIGPMSVFYGCYFAGPVKKTACLKF